MSDTSSTLTAVGAESDSQWVAPFATRLDLDTLEDLVEGAGGFVTDRCDALSPSKPCLLCSRIFSAKEAVQFTHFWEHPPPKSSFEATVE